MDKVLFTSRLLVGLDTNGYRVHVDIQITERNGQTRLSMRGDVTRGRAWASCGQIVDLIADRRSFRRYLVSTRQIRQMVGIWNAYHLNDMQGSCQHQRRAGITFNNNQGHVCPTCGYKVGTQWLYMPIPAHVIDTVKSWKSGKM